MIDYGWSRGKWRVDYQTDEGVRGQLPATWTDMGPKDPFVEQSQGRAIARLEDLLELARITAEHVKEITPKRKANHAATPVRHTSKTGVKLDD